MMNDITLFCGDCADMMAKMPNDSIDCIVTDPPFGLAFKNDIYDDSKKEIEKNIPIWYNEWMRILKPTAYLFIYCGILNINVWINEAMKAGFYFRNILSTRSFNRGGITGRGNFVFEFQPVLVFSKGKGRAFNKVDFFKQSKAWMHDKRNKHPSKFTYSYSNYIPSELTYGTEKFGALAKGREFHPNAKSVKLETFLIEISTDEHDTIFDPFMGSGTTALAATRCGRNFIGCELNEKWYKRAKARIAGDMPLFNKAIKEV